MCKNVFGMGIVLHITVCSVITEERKKYGRNSDSLPTYTF